MGPATCYTTNMTRRVIRPTYKGDGGYLPWLQGENRPFSETARERERQGERAREKVKEDRDQ